jgi:hypothetical protein
VDTCGPRARHPCGLPPSRTHAGSQTIIQGEPSSPLQLVFWCGKLTETKGNPFPLYARLTAGFGMTFRGEGATPSLKIAEWSPWAGSMPWRGLRGHKLEFSLALLCCPPCGQLVSTTSDPKSLLKGLVEGWLICNLFSAEINLVFSPPFFVHCQQFCQYPFVTCTVVFNTEAFSSIPTSSHCCSGFIVWGYCLLWWI